MKNFLKGIGVGIALTFAWTYFYFYSGLVSFSMIGKLSDSDRETLLALRIRRLVLYWSVVGLLFVLAFWLRGHAKLKLAERNRRPIANVEKSYVAAIGFQHGSKSSPGAHRGNDHRMFTAAAR